MLPRSGSAEDLEQNPSVPTVVVLALRKKREEPGAHFCGCTNGSKGLATRQPQF